MNLLPEMDFEVEVWSIWGGGDDTCLREYKAALTPQLLTTRCSSAPGHAQQWTSKIRRPWVPGTPGQARPGACCIAQCPRGRCLYFQDRTIGHQALCSARPKAVGRNGSDRGSHCDARKGIFLRGDVEQPACRFAAEGPIGGRRRDRRSAFPAGDPRHVEPPTARVRRPLNRSGDAMQRGQDYHPT